jgi:hypothetical protein
MKTVASKYWMKEIQRKMLFYVSWLPQLRKDKLTRTKLKNGFKISIISLTDVNQRKLNLTNPLKISKILLS